MREIDQRRVRHKVMNQVAVFVVALLVIIALTAGYRATLTHVILDIDGKIREIATHQPSVAMLLADLNISLRPEDRISPELDTALVSGLTIQVTRAKPIVVSVDGREYLLYAHNEPPADLLAKLDVPLDSHDVIRIQPPLASDPLETRYRVIVERAAKVVIERGAVRTEFYTTATTVGEALLQAGIELYRADRLLPGPATPIQHGMHIQLDRSIPVSVNVDGHMLRTRTHRTRVGEVLADLGVTLNGQDYTIPPLDTGLGDGLEVRIVRVTESVIVEQSPIPFETVWQPDGELEIDNQRLLQEGQPGVLELRIRVRYEDGQVVDRWQEGSSVVLAPINRTMGYGTKVIVRQLQTDSGVVNYWRVVRMLATSYSANTAGVSTSSSYYGITATGMKMRHGIVAVDPNVIPLMTRVYVPGYGVGVAGDTGGAIKGKRIDLGYDDDNLKLWRSWVDVYLLTPVPETINYFGL